MSTIRSSAIAGLKKGHRFGVVRRFTSKDIERFAAVTRDYNPVHFEPRFTEAKDIPGLVCHGLLVGGMLTEIGGQIGWLASGMAFRFKRPVFAGDTVHCGLTITEVDGRGRARASAVFHNQDGQLVLEAELTGIIPGPAERRVLSKMAAEGDPTNPCRDAPYTVEKI